MYIVHVYTFPYTIIHVPTLPLPLHRLLAEGPRLSDIAQPPVVQSYSHSIPQPGMTPETHAVNHTLPQLQSGIGTQPFHQNGLRTQPQQNRMQLSGMNQPTVQPQYGMGVHMQPGMGTQPTVNAGMGIQQNGMAISMKNGTETQQLSTVYYSNPGQFAPNEVHIHVYTCIYMYMYMYSIVHVHVCMYTHSV